MASAACSSSGRYGVPCISIAVVMPFRAVPIPFETRPPTPGMKLAALDAALLAVLTFFSVCLLGVGPRLPRLGVGELHVGDLVREQGAQRRADRAS